MFKKPYKIDQWTFNLIKIPISTNRRKQNLPFDRQHCNSMKSVRLLTSFSKRFHYNGALLKVKSSAERIFPLHDDSLEEGNWSFFLLQNLNQNSTYLTNYIQQNSLHNLTVAQRVRKCHTYAVWRFIIVSEERATGAYTETISDDTPVTYVFRIPFNTILTSTPGSFTVLWRKICMHFPCLVSSTSTTVILDSATLIISCEKQTF
jgi:hypothetical protein